MLVLLHGENVGASRQALLDLKKNYSSDSISVFEAENLEVDELIRACETPSLLSDRRLIIIEGKPPVASNQLSVASKQLPATDIVFWVGEELKPSHKLFKLVRDLGGQIRCFRPTIPKHIFGFLDALGYKNRKRAFLELHRLLDQGESPLYLLKMMVWQARNLLRVKVSKSQSVKGVNPYVLRKVQSQVENFGEEELVGIFKELLKAEVKLKTTQLDSKLVLDRLVDKWLNG